MHFYEDAQREHKAVLQSCESLGLEMNNSNIY